VVQLSQILQPLTVASFYRTAPISDIPQPPFLNSAVTGRTDLSPGQLLACTKRIEQASGRIAGIRFGPRRLDIDLLIYGNLMQDLPELRIPHPELRNRRFALEPLAEIAPSLEVPPDGSSVFELLARLGSGQQVIRLES
jgi:2-amino-4-hydroxy-6-hydroxymethyldihydropteridine diphosphokinase